MILDTGRTETSRADTLAVGSVIFGLLGLGLCWWFPFGLILGAAGLVFTIASWLAGVGRLFWIGSVYSAASVATTLVAGWGSSLRLLGW